MSTVTNGSEGAAQSPTLEDVIASPATSFWLLASLQTAVLRDPVDAVNDAELLLQLLQKRLDDLVTPAF